MSNKYDLMFVQSQQLESVKIRSGPFELLLLQMEALLSADLKDFAGFFFSLKLGKPRKNT